MSANPFLFSSNTDNLTASQTRALYRLWHRFFRLCEMPAGSLGGLNTDENVQSNKKASSKEIAKQISASSLGEKVDGSPVQNDTKFDGRRSEDVLRNSATTSVRPGSSTRTDASYGKPLQRQSSSVRQIDERGSHIPKDDRVKDELKTLEEAKEMREFLERYGGERLRQIFWEMVKGEHPDAIMLRFLRARKWNVDRAIAVIGSTAAFRADNDVAAILRGGELALTSTRGGRNMLANGISYIYGATSIGEPVYIIEVGNHFSHNQTQQELKKGVIFLQETLQLLMPPPIERKVVIFNMNEFGIRNMDWWCVFFMVKTMESYYVETLARVYVHGAPWIFKPIWAILKPLLDPVVRDKVRLTFSAEELAEHVPFTHLPKGTMRGGMDWKFEWPAPDPHENDQQLDTATRDTLQQEYMAVAAEFEAATKEIATMYARASLMRRRETNSRRRDTRQGFSLSSDEEDEDVLYNSQSRRPSDGTILTSGGQTNPNTSSDDIGTSLKAKRDVLATKLRVAFLKLRPYIVGKSMVDRWNVIKDDGRIVWKYKSIDGEEEEQILGEGTTLPELQRNLEMIEEASAQNQANNDFEAPSSNHRRTPTLPSSSHLPGQQMGNISNSALVSANSPTNGSPNEMNRRQQRLKNRSRPSSGALEANEAAKESTENGVSSLNKENGNFSSVEQLTETLQSKANIHKDSSDTTDTSNQPVPVHPLHQSTVSQEK